MASAGVVIWGVIGTHTDDRSRRRSRERRDPSPWRDRAVSESLALFEDMRRGLVDEGAATLRLRMDPWNDNPALHDPVAYRIKFADHPRTGAGWPRARWEVASRSERMWCSSLCIGTSPSARVTPFSRQKAWMARWVTPRRRSPAKVSRRGSSQPSTYPSATMRFSFRFDKTACAMFSREYSQTTGLYMPSVCRSQ